MHRGRAGEQENRVGPATRPHVFDPQVDVKREVSAGVLVISEIQCGAPRRTTRVSLVQWEVDKFRCPDKVVVELGVA